MTKKSRDKDDFYLSIRVLCQRATLTPVYEYRFHPSRLWRFDIALPELKVAIEFEGGVFKRVGGHTTGGGFTGDCEKYNQAALLGWRVLRYTAPMVRKHMHFRDLQTVLALP